MVLFNSKVMNFTFFIGIDISKNELDFAVRQGSEFLFHQEILNTPAAITAFIKELFKLPCFSLETTIFCMEHTGIYNNHLLHTLDKLKGKVCLEAATQIRNSLGNIRGKNDKVDAIRICDYAYKNRESLRLWSPKRTILIQLSHLTAVRSRLIDSQKSLSTPLKENRSFISKSMDKQVGQTCNNTLKAIKADLKKVDQMIKKIIMDDPELKRLFTLVTSVSGIGTITATQIIISTNEFKGISEAKKFACYAGVVPFTKESGLYKGKPRISHMANKKLKTLLHLAALVAIQHNQDLKEYYQRKVIGEKKNKMSTINAVRNKLILRIFACVKQNKIYEQNYLKLVA